MCKEKLVRYIRKSTSSGKNISFIFFDLMPFLVVNIARLQNLSYKGVIAVLVILVRSSRIAYDVFSYIESADVTYFYFCQNDGAKVPGARVPWICARKAAKVSVYIDVTHFFDIAHRLSLPTSAASYILDLDSVGNYGKGFNVNIRLMLLVILPSVLLLS